MMKVPGLPRLKHMVDRKVTKLASSQAWNPSKVMLWKTREADLIWVRDHCWNKRGGALNISYILILLFKLLDGCLDILFLTICLFTLLHLASTKIGAPVLQTGV